MFEAGLSTSTSSSPSKEQPLLTRLKSCLQLSAAFTETVQQLKETILHQHVTFGLSGMQLGLQSSISRKTSSFSSSSKGAATGVPGENIEVSPSISGIHLQNVEAITSALSEFSTRVNQILGIVNTLAKFRRMAGNLEGLPLVSGLWDAVGDESNVQSHAATPSNADPVVHPIGSLESKGIVFGVSLDTVKEESPVPSSTEGFSIGSASYSESHVQKHSAMSNRTATSCSHTETPPLSRHTSTHTTTAAASASATTIAMVVDSSVKKIQRKLEMGCRGGVAEVFCTHGKKRSTFPTAHGAYCSQVSGLEEKIQTYLQVGFSFTRIYLHYVY